MARKGTRPGRLVETSEGKKGFIYNDEEQINGKHRVYIVDDNFQPTKEKLLCLPESLTIKGYID